MFIRSIANSKALMRGAKFGRKYSPFVAPVETKNQFGALLLCGLMTIGFVTSKSTTCDETKAGTKLEKENLAKWATAPARKFHSFTFMLLLTSLYCRSCIWNKNLCWKF